MSVTGHSSSYELANFHYHALVSHPPASYHNPPSAYIPRWLAPWAGPASLQLGSFLNQVLHIQKTCADTIPAYVDAVIVTSFQCVLGLLYAAQCKQRKLSAVWCVLSAHRRSSHALNPDPERLSEMTADFGVVPLTTAERCSSVRSNRVPILSFQGNVTAAGGPRPSAKKGQAAFALTMPLNFKY